jgi:hypothetical protein
VGDVGVDRTNIGVDCPKIGVDWTNIVVDGGKGDADRAHRAADLPRRASVARPASIFTSTPYTPKAKIDSFAQESIF